MSNDANIFFSNNDRVPSLAPDMDDDLNQDDDLAHLLINILEEPSKSRAGFEDISNNSKAPIASLSNVATTNSTSQLSKSYMNPRVDLQARVPRNFCSKTSAPPTVPSAPIDALPNPAASFVEKMPASAGRMTLRTKKSENNVRYQTANASAPFAAMSPAKAASTAAMSSQELAQQELIQQGHDKSTVRRLLRNRASAALHRERKRAYIDKLEGDVRERDCTIAKLQRENEELRCRLLNCQTVSPNHVSSALEIGFEPPRTMPLPPVEMGPGCEEEEAVVVAEWPPATASSFPAPLCSEKKRTGNEMSANSGSEDARQMPSKAARF